MRVIAEAVTKFGEASWDESAPVADLRMISGSLSDLSWKSSDGGTSSVWTPRQNTDLVTALQVIA